MDIRGPDRPSNAPCCLDLLRRHLRLFLGLRIGLDSRPYLWLLPAFQFEHAPAREEFIRLRTGWGCIEQCVIAWTDTSASCPRRARLFPRFGSGWRLGRQRIAGLEPYAARQ